jgi:DNA invertase Pin-like site-specific DNA recombinase
VKPVLLGYLSARMDGSNDAVVNGRRVLAAFADREGYTLDEIFMDTDSAQPISAFVALLAAVRRGGAAAVVVPSVEHLGRTARERQTMRVLLEREGIARLLVAQPMGVAAGLDVRDVHDG